ncbi:colicin E3/pyocin S6 family cytotoxin [Enterococcus sp. LJL128]
MLSDKSFKVNKSKGRIKGAVVYEKDGKFYHRDTFHRGEGSHIEVYDKRGNHLGEANHQTGELIPGTQDKTKKLPR